MISTALLVCIGSLALAEPPRVDPDTDGDGLSDFQEVHKHLTHPFKPDSDADGVPDGDASERREFTYTVRAVMHVFKPVNAETLTDDYQDGRILEDHPDYVAIEVIHYPFNTCGQVIGDKGNWRSEHAASEALAPYLEAGVTTNWDGAMQAELLAKLEADGIDVDELGDRTAVERVSKWLMNHVRSEDSFMTFGVEFTDGKPHIRPAIMDSVNRELARRGRTLEEQWDHELFGKGMFRTGMMGTCTSAAIYLSTCLKAIGLPTRTIIVVPVLDGNDDAERSMAATLTNHRVRRIIQRAAAQQKGTWTSHTFNEVFIDGRWRRLNYHRLGQNILDPDGLGLMTHVHTYADHAEAGLVGWSRRNASADKHSDVCGYANPYSCIEISDHFGAHCKLDNPAADEGLSRLTISRIYWYDDPAKEPVVSMRLDHADTAGHLLVHVEEDVERSAYRDCYAKIAKEFRLRAPGREDIRVIATRGFWIDPDRGVREFYLQIPPEEFPKMASGVTYELVPPRGVTGEPAWAVREGVTITRAK